MHPFGSSREEKRVCVRLSMGGGHDQSWSFHGSPWGARWRGEGGGRRKGRGCAAGYVGGGGAMWVAALGRAAGHLLPARAWLFVAVSACS
jgi:hypothetical protein